ncbi:hypothetical protein ACP70R_043994 [Stipagrostis hirtigluma subsp. patula]
MFTVRSGGSRLAAAPAKPVARRAAYGRRVAIERGRHPIRSRRGANSSGMAPLLGASASKKRRASDEAAEAAAAADPQELRLRILALLPLKPAIRTGVLSTRWRALWTRRWPAPASLDLHLRSGIDDPDQLLESLHRRGHRRLDRFSLTFPFGEYGRPNRPHRYFRDKDIHRCLDYAAACDVEDLHLDITDHFMSIGSMLDFPPACPRLARLSLRYVGHVFFAYSLPSDAYSALEVIRIHSARSVDVDRLLSACPRLRTLDLRYCEFLEGCIYASRSEQLRSLTVAECNRVTRLYAGTAAGLRSFRLSSALLPTYRIAAAALLEDLYISLRGPSISYPLKHWIQALPNLANLTVLTICSIALRRIYALARFGSATCLTKLRKLPSLRELQLLMFAMDRTSLAHIYIFLQTCRCPQLERLFVQLPTSSHDTSVRNSLVVAEDDEPEEDVTEDDEPEEDLSKEDVTEDDEPEETLSEEDVTEDELLQEEMVQEYMLEERPLYEDVYEEDHLEEDVAQEECFEEDVPEYDLGNLTFVRMMKFKGCYFEMRLVSFLLRKCVGLKKLLLVVASEGNHIDLGGKDPLDLSPFLETKLLPFKSASPNVQIILSEYDSDGIEPVHSDVFAKF